jgi:hypothetical protein
MVKFSTAAPAVPLSVTLACDPADPVVTVPTLTAAAAPVGPVGPALPACASTAHTAGNKSGSNAELPVFARYVVPPNEAASFG